MNLRQLLSGFFVLIYFLSAPAYVIAQEDTLNHHILIEDGYVKVRLYLHLSQSLKMTNIDSAFYYADQARTTALLEGDDEGVAESLFIIGKIGLQMDSFDHAKDNFYRALEYTEACDCDSLEASIYMYLGKLYCFRDNYNEAIINFLLSLEIAEESIHTYILSDLLDDIGLVMTYLEDYDQAMEYFERAKAVNEEFGDQRIIATTLRNIALVHFSKKQYLQAEELYLQALGIYTRLNYDPGIATSKIGLGNIKFNMEKYDLALKYYEEALALALKININPRILGPYIQAYCYNRLGETYFKLEQYDKAIEVLRLSSDLSEEMGMPGRKAGASKILSQLYEKKGNTILAFEYFKNFKELSDSIINARNVSSITKLEMEYKYLKKKKEKELLDLQEKESAKRKELLYQISIGIAVVIVILLIFILVLYRKNERNKSKQSELREKNLELENDNLQKELEYKNKELTTSVMYQLKKNNFIWNVSEKLKGIALNLTPENRKSIKSIVKEMEGNMSKESWEEFEFRFNEVHNDFYDNLLKEFPDLTPNELKLCAFLKLNMTTKDIATITYQTTHSITVARYRLRNKLKLERDDNLVSSLSKF